MNRYIQIKRAIVIVVIILLSNIFVQPIYAENSLTTIEDEFIEFPIEIYRGKKEVHTVKIHRDNVVQIEQLLSNIEKQLKMIKSSDEAAIVFNKAVIQLYEFGFFPKDMSIKDAQRLVNGRFNFQRFSSINSKKGQNDNENFNVFCRVGGLVETPLITGIPGKILLTILTLYNVFWAEQGFPYLWFYPLSWILFPLAEIQYANPFHLGHWLYIGFKPDLASNGWVNSFGLFGVKTWEGKFWGNLPFSNTFLNLWDYPAAIGFFGYKIPRKLFEFDDYIFMGFALGFGLEYK